MVEKKFFQEAKPIWEVGTKNSVNRSLMLCSNISKVTDAKLRISGHTVYARHLCDNHLIWFRYKCLLSRTITFIRAPPHF